MTAWIASQLKARADGRAEAVNSVSRSWRVLSSACFIAAVDVDRAERSICAHMGQRLLSSILKTNAVWPPRPQAVRYNSSNDISIIANDGEGHFSIVATKNAKSFIRVSRRSLVLLISETNAPCRLQNPSRKRHMQWSDRILIYRRIVNVQYYFQIISIRSRRSSTFRFAFIFLFICSL